MAAPASTPRASSQRCSRRWARITRQRPSSSPKKVMKIYLAGPDVFLPDALDIGQRKREICTRHGVTGAKDRKSTRLNSSHMSISYAVFCLKKKKKKIDNDSSILKVSFLIDISL